MQIEKRNNLIEIYIDKDDSENELYAGVMFVEIAGCDRLIIESEVIIPEDSFDEIEIGGMKLVKKGDYHIVYELI